MNNHKKLKEEDAFIKDWKAEYRKSIEDPDVFWGEVAAEFTWFKKWDKVLEWSYPNARWFVGGRLNITCNCLDRHVNSERKNKIALFGRAKTGPRKHTATTSCCFM